LFGIRTRFVFEVVGCHLVGNRLQSERDRRRPSSGLSGCRRRDCCRRSAWESGSSGPCGRIGGRVRSDRGGPCRLPPRGGRRYTRDNQERTAFRGGRLSRPGGLRGRICRGFYRRRIQGWRCQRGGLILCLAQGHTCAAKHSESDATHDAPDHCSLTIGGIDVDERPNLIFIHRPIDRAVIPFSVRASILPG
jgi:hypothetical protein